MTTCPSCYADNVSGAVECRDCKRPLTATAPLCRNGHTMDPAWTECGYCRAEGRLAPLPYRPTRPEIQPTPPLAAGSSRQTTWEQPPMPGPVAPAFSVPRPNLPPRDGQTPPPRKTVFTLPANLGAEASASPGAKRHQQKIVAVLVTYTWQPEGQVFPIHEGRNRLGRDAAQCDVAVPLDNAMSAIHSSIAFRTKFVISDLDSMSGTYVNGTPVEEQFYTLPNYAEIRTGATVWTFVILNPAAVASSAVSLA